MGKIKARKVMTPGSAGKVRGKGRPKLPKMKAGTSRVGNYRHKYTDETLQLALGAIRNKDMKLSEAAVHFRVPKTTLYDRLSNKSSANLGRPTELTADEEALIVERLIFMSDWAFPLSNRDLRVLIKEYLDVDGRTSRNLSYYLFLLLLI